MTGDGSGGGGAVAAFLGLWLVVMAFVIVPQVLDLGSGPDASLAPPSPIAAVSPTAEPAPTPSLERLDCGTEEDCAAELRRDELAGAIAGTLALPDATEDYFTDDDGTPFEDDINRAAQSGLLTGCEDDGYCPGGVVTRGQIASVLARALELPLATADYFDDDAGSTHEAAINRVAAAGIASGCGERAYCPDDPVTRGELRALVTRALGSSAP